MTKDEALKLALEVLEEGVQGTRPLGVATLEAIATIKEALAQPEVFSKQNYLNGYCVGQSDLLAEQAKQEPAAWMVYTQDGKAVYMTDNPTEIEENQRALPLYATPQRTWVGLTDEEIARVVSLAGFSPDWAEANIATQIVRVLEAKLKEKNT